MRRTIPLFILSLLLASASAASAAVRLPRIFGSDMVLQQQMPLRFWGWDAPAQDVTITLSTDGKSVATASAPANANGRFEIALPAMKADGRTYVVNVKGSSELNFTGVAIGEVWLCSGQSNMEMGMGLIDNHATEIAAADQPDLHLFMVPNRVAGLPQDDVEAKPEMKDVEGLWKLCTPTTVAVGGWNGFSAAAYYFGRHLHETLKVPVGLIDSTWGGTMIEPWTAPQGFASVPRLKSVADSIQATQKEFLAAGADAVQASVAKGSTGEPANLYNGMIHPLVPFALRGALWYQGEANVDAQDGLNYTEKMQALIQGWRALWPDTELPFYYVQLAPLSANSPGYNRLPLFWQAQSQVQALPHTGMVLTTDITKDLADIHPTDKKDVGLRLANLALHDTYGLADVVCRSPEFKSMKVDGEKVMVTFDHADGGLSTRDGKAPNYFMVAGADGVFADADAKITGPDQVTITSEKVTAPTAVRYGWLQIAQVNLKNGAGLPANSFRTDVDKRLESLALDKPVTSSGMAQGSHVPANVTDGIANNTSGWHCGEPNRWVQIDLEKAQPINRVMVYPYYDEKRFYQYVVDVSVDGKDWKRVADMSTASEPETAAGHEHAFAETSARYVRVMMLKNSANPGVHLNEVLVLGPESH